jgi:hypothetical protein
MIRSTSRSISLLMASLLCVTALSACNKGGFIDQITGDDGRDEQMLAGPRRKPMLNPQGSMVITQPSDPSQAHQLTPEMQRMAASNPFDQYNGSGAQPVIPASPAPASVPVASAAPAPVVIQETPTQNQPSAFDRWLGTWESDKAETAPASAAATATKKTGEVRKPFMGSLDAPAEITPVVPVMPITSADANTAPVPLMAAPESDGPSASFSAQPIADRDMEQTPPAPEPKIVRGLYRPSFFERLGNSLRSIGGEEPKVEEKVEGEFPTLSAVPATPVQFKEIKSEKQERMDDLSVAHSVAQEEKQALDAEPSQQAATLVAEEAPAKPEIKTLSTKTTTITVPQTPTSESKAPVIVTTKTAEAPSGNEPVLLGQMSDKKAPVATRTTTITVPQEASAVQNAAKMEPVEVKVEEKTITTESDSKPWWSGWKLNQDENKASSEAPVKIETVETMPSANAPKHLEAAEEEVVDSTKPLLTSGPAKPAYQPPASQPIVSNTPVATDTADNTASSDSTAATSGDNTLPSPQVLKTLPPSRYNTRAKDRQFYMVP